MDPYEGKLKVVWGVVERGQRVRFSRLGVGWERADGVIVAQLDVVPLSGRIEVRDFARAPESGPGQPEEVAQ